MDIFDRAQEADEFFRQVALRDHFSRQGKTEGSEAQLGQDGDMMPHRVPILPGRCLDCGDKIRAARLAANPKAVRCVGCQTLKERS